MTNLDNINWLEEVTKRQEDLLADLFRMIRIRSVREDDLATPEAPVGPGPKKALEEFLKMAQEDGFETKQFGPLVGRVEIGEGDSTLGILGHLDVVPEGTGWDTDPYEPVIKEGRIYARGSSDDKGPTIGAYFAIKLLRELGAEFNQKIHLIVGTDEESGWMCMDHYAKVAEMPDYGFSPDAQFPIINGEKGNVSARFKFEAKEAVEAGNKLIDFQAGLRANMVPQEAYATVVSDQSEKLKADFQKYLEEQPVSGQVTEEANQLRFEITGKAAHGSTPEKGHNAGTYLASFLNNYQFDKQEANDFLALVGDKLHVDFEGEKIGVAIVDDIMGALSMNVGIINFDDTKGGLVDANFRYPKGTDKDQIQAQISDKLTDLSFDLEMTGAKEPHYLSTDDPMVKTLLDVYAKQTGNEVYEKTIGGGTYGRLMKRGVSFGVLFPDSIDTMHQANEFLAMNDLLRATAIYAECIYRLTR
ncbi:dipeptidase PepV [Facklamia miroungae]|uniref:Succinyl-diaminopimelate desuccinylase n=1 Tax=Facklamia miroungae TaxID=120956 RepID=A0A1G7UPY7_9LACT|nr:dipeptidase PepV [Facklamia miroungae]NKZ30168.1 dipeptidase PepV [Facklamia miroungae]SDG49576.1 succinyl-diaminopimelate desuccinylase [Facklamia miroungae]